MQNRSLFLLIGITFASALFYLYRPPPPAIKQLYKYSLYLLTAFTYFAVARHYNRLGWATVVFLLGFGIAYFAWRGEEVWQVTEEESPVGKAYGN